MTVLRCGEVRRLRFASGLPAMEKSRIGRFDVQRVISLRVLSTRVRGMSRLETP